MKTRAIGEISHGGGFPRLIKDVQESQEPLVIMKNNTEAAIVLPFSREMVTILEQSFNLGAAMRQFISGRMDSELELYLVGQYLAGLQARALLFTAHSDNGVELSAWEDAVVVSVRQSVRDIMKNSSEEGGSVSPMTTTRADVSEVKQEELPLGNSSLSPKREKSKKQTSSPQKRKIGTKREKSA
jgi:PHD/YefM family antitoxin component YafN of YafNO toxin-antitoxin module